MPRPAGVFAAPALLSGLALVACRPASAGAGCGGLGACCGSLPDADVAGCVALAQSGDQPACDQAIASLQTATYCNRIGLFDAGDGGWDGPFFGGESGSAGASCATLLACCRSPLFPASIAAACVDVAANAPLMCDVAYADYKAAGDCP